MSEAKRKSAAKKPAKKAPANLEASQAADAPAWRRHMDRVSVVRDYGVVVILGVIFVVLAMTSDVFLTSANLRNVVDQSVAVGLLAVAGALVIIAGGFDLSAGAIFAVAALVGAKVSNSVGPEVGILAGIGVGLLLGLINGLICTYGRINHFVGTLATSIVYTGTAYVIASGDLILIEDQGFQDFSQADILSVNASTWVFIAFALVCAFLLNRTVFGRHIFATGGNLSAARLSGIPVERTQIYTYMLSGVAGALAGLIVASRALSVNAQTGTGIIFDVLAAILIGGISVLGGAGAVWRAIVGVFILALISNGFNLNGVDPLYQDIVAGMIILIAVGADAWWRRESTSR